MGGGGGAHSPSGEGGPNSDDWRKSLALCLLCGLWVEGLKRLYPKIEVPNSSLDVYRCGLGHAENTFLELYKVD